MKLDPKEFEYLWTDYYVNFIFTSCYLTKTFKDSDSLLIYSHEDKGLRFYLGKNDMEKYAEHGLILYDKEFEPLKKSMLANVSVGKKLIEESKNDKEQVSSMSDEELKEKILARADLFNKLEDNYFYTEFYYTEKASELVEKEPEKFKNLKANLEKLGEIKYDARKVMNELYNYKRMFAQYVEEAKKRFKRSDLEWLYIDEMRDVMEGKDVKTSDLDKTNWVLTKRNGWEIIKGDDADKILAVFDNHFFKRDETEAKGSVANPGKHVGIVKTLRTVFSDDVIKEIKKVEEGDVLMASTTGPEVMEACSKAGAIVTEEGGITSHAAIVSRELKIPCIVGAKYVTKIFKDGDKVEVDAEKGIVKKI